MKAPGENYEKLCLYLMPTIGAVMMTGECCPVCVLSPNPSVYKEEISI